MVKKKKAYKANKKRPLSYRFLSCLMKIFIRKPKTVILGKKPLSEKAIYVMNHCGARGPLAFELYFPVRANPWGTHEMCGTYKERWNYLYHVFYQQKLHWGKFKSFVVATLFAVISKWCYRSIGLIGTYQDMRLVETIRDSVSVIQKDMSILIFPEDSTEGYADKAPAYHSGFIALSRIYFQQKKEDLPVYSVYFSKKKKKFVVDEPLYINEMISEGKSEEEVSTIFLKHEHRLYDDYIAGNQPCTA